ncbi:hypothetical protein W97_06202 [Coniosporium apollinis CBS 100218]|uniref:Uncharacterized protein n=1 Tax=Coniosporium apollinis (strain CBS 100218) TaxID=1168221 RepID=R7YXX8_CONA1|nr:uncharacterized protein W97_06202 [Coniosporium apollinis CBS 100218]EON66800.1 hypothetical protein W97_06202 [Coniosporium apollinis CBS 100218]
MGRRSRFFATASRKAHTEKDAEIETPDSSWNDDSYAPFGVVLQSKAERLLGTSGLPTSHYPGSASAQCSASTPNLETSPNYTNITLSEASVESDIEIPGARTVEGIAIPPQFRTLNPKPSSNVLGMHNYDSPRSGSISSHTSGRLHHQGSSSTLRSYYDPAKSPLSISQQTSASAVRDMALRKGHPSKLRDTIEYNGSRESLSLSKVVNRAAATPPQNSRGNKPRKIDLSSLFPKPRRLGAQGGAMLSPNKFVDSPDRVSATSEYFPVQKLEAPSRPNVPSIKSNRSIQEERRVLTKPNPHSPQRTVQREIYDNAKVNIRRPPRGIQNWFDGLLEEEDEDSLEEEKLLEAGPPVSQYTYNQNTSSSSHLQRQPSPEKMFNCDGARVDIQNRYLNPVSHFSTTTQQTTPQYPPNERRESHSSLYSHVTGTSAITRESKLSSSNLQTESILSFSSEEEDANHRLQNSACGSIAITADNDSRINTRKPRPGRDSPQPYVGRKKKPPEIDTSRYTATTYSVFPPSSDTEHFPLPRHSRGMRQSQAPSSILVSSPLQSPTSMGTISAIASPTESQFALSARSSRSEPSALQTEQHKLMAVTKEEEALLEMLRHKRTAMAKHNFTQGYKTALKQGKVEKRKSRQPPPAPMDFSALRPPETSGYLETVMPGPDGRVSPGLPGDVLGAFPTPDALKERAASVASNSPLSPRFHVTTTTALPNRPRNSQPTGPLSSCNRDPPSHSSDAPSPRPYYHLPARTTAFAPLSVSIPSPTLPLHMTLPVPLTPPILAFPAAARGGDGGASPNRSPVPGLTPSRARHRHQSSAESGALGEYGEEEEERGYGDAGGGALGRGVAIKVAGSVDGGSDVGGDDGPGEAGEAEEEREEAGWCHAITTDNHADLAVPHRKETEPREGRGGLAARRRTVGFGAPRLRAEVGDPGLAMTTTQAGCVRDSAGSVGQDILEAWGSLGGWRGDVVGRAVG